MPDWGALIRSAALPFVGAALGGAQAGSRQGVNMDEFNRVLAENAERKRQQAANRAQWEALRTITGGAVPPEQISAAEAGGLDPGAIQFMLPKTTRDPYTGEVLRTDPLTGQMVSEGVVGIPRPAKTASQPVVYDAKRGVMVNKATGEVISPPGLPPLPPPRPRETVEEYAAKQAAGAKARLAAEMGVYDTATGGMPAAPPGTETAAPNRPVNESVLQGVDPGTQDMVRLLTDYKIPLPSGFALRSPRWMRLLTLAAQYDPSFDATQYNVRMGVRRDFTAGPSSKVVNSINTVIGHLDTLQKRAAELHASGSVPLNWSRNFMRTYYKGNPQVKNFNIARDAVANEMTRVFRGTGGSQKDIEGWKTSFSAAGTPEQLQGGIDQAIDLMESRIEALQNQYERGMGRPLDFQLLSPRAAQVLGQLRSGATPGVTAGVPAPAPVPTVTGKLTVRRKSDGQIGVISPQYFDPGKFEKVEEPQ